MKKRSVVPYSFNEDYMKEVSKEDFVKAHEHLDDVVDLEAEWDKYHPVSKDISLNKDKEKPKPAQA